MDTHHGLEAHARRRKGGGRGQAGEGDDGEQEEDGRELQLNAMTGQEEELESGPCDEEGWLAAAALLTLVPITGPLPSRRGRQAPACTQHGERYSPFASQIIEKVVGRTSKTGRQ